MGTIIVVDDHKNTREAISKLLKSKQLDHVTKINAEEAFEIFKKENVDLIITDLRLPGKSGLEFLKQVRLVDDQIPVILITAYATIQTAVEAMKLGAYDYITKPFSVDEIEIKVDKALATRNLTIENRYLQMENEYLREEARLHFSEIIGHSQSMQRVYSLIEKLAPANTHILITGESGTGKELIARAVHYNSPRKNKPFIKVNCSVLAEGVLESELFGHEKGAFTGAYKRKLGRFEIADEGTIFIDEVGEIPPSTQVKLLRVLQEKEFERVGGSETLKMKARLVTATNQDLLEGIKNKSFREDLYYRLNVVAIDLPPLRERQDDIPLLVRHFIDKYNGETGKQINGIDSDAMKLLMTYNWPGNVRELENVVERAIVLSTEQKITTIELPPNLISSSVDVDGTKDNILKNLSENTKNYEKELITSALKENNGNISKTARVLGIKRTTLRYKMEKYELIG